MATTDEGTGETGPDPAADGFAAPPASEPDPPDSEPDPTVVRPPTRSETRRRLMDFGVVTAVAALLFSASTYWIDRRGQDRADDRQARSELTEVVGKMAALPRDYAVLTLPGSGADAGAVSSNFTSELIILVAQAERLVADYSSVAGPADYLSIGFAHLNLGNYEQAIDAFDAAKRRAAAESDERLVTAALTDSAVARFGLGRAGTGRALFRRAIARAGENGRSAAQIRTDVDFILRRWAQTELVVGNCATASELIGQIGVPGTRAAALGDYETTCGPTG